MRILHVLHRSVPGTHGYAIRSREIVRHQLKRGIEPLVLTSPSQAPLGPLDRERSEYIDGIRYFRTGGDILPATRDVDDASPLRSSLRVLQNVALFTTGLRIARTYRPAVIHAHSPFTCGLVADAVGRIVGIPVVYEMRGIWEDSHTSRFGLSEQSMRYRAVRGLETRALRHADMCCVICEALRDEVVSRGVNPDRVFIVPNGVDTAEFQPGPADGELRTRLGLNGRTVVGYIGSLFSYEGLDILLEAVIRLAPEIPDLSLLLVGDGEAMDGLRRGASEARIEDRVVFAGRVPYRDTMEYYRLCDIMALPRRDTRETRLVTPLKPMEIMAMGKPLIVSDIGGHREIVEEGVNGLFFRAEDTADLAEKCRSLLADRGLRERLSSTGRAWVEANRDWSVIVGRYAEVYERLVGK